jgi:DNA-directed RNA polymerase specialized sigma24 family protein
MLEENKIRVEYLIRNHKEWLDSVAMNITKDKAEGEDLLGDLYLYLLEKGTPKIYFKESFNLMYCYSYLKTRWINRTKIKGRFSDKEVDVVDSEYDYEWDLRLEECYTEVLTTLKDLESTKLWAASKLTSMYLFTDLTLEGLGKEIGISKSTSYLSVKKIKDYLKQHIENPFKNETKSYSKKIQQRNSNN